MANAHLFHRFLNDVTVISRHASPEISIGRTSHGYKLCHRHVLNAGLLCQHNANETAQFAVTIVVQFAASNKDVSTQLRLEGRQGT